MILKYRGGKLLKGYKYSCYWERAGPGSAYDGFPAQATVFNEFLGTAFPATQVSLVSPQKKFRLLLKLYYIWVITVKVADSSVVEWLHITRLLLTFKTKPRLLICIFQTICCVALAQEILGPYCRDLCKKTDSCADIFDSSTWRPSQKKKRKKIK